MVKGKERGQMTRRGFTLIELIMVIVIIGILAAIAIPKFVSLTTDAKSAATRGGLGAIRSAVAIQYAKSATSGSASFPSSITTDFFADGKIPTNQLNTYTAVSNVGSTVNGTSTSGSAGWWYVTDSSNAAYGQVGAYSDGTVNTSSW